VRSQVSDAEYYLRLHSPASVRHPPGSFEEQAEQAWKNVLALLEHAGLGPQNLIKVSQYLVRPDDIPRYRPIRSKWLGDHRPASMLAVIPGLVRPDFLIEIEAYTAAPNEANGAKG
jgi:enamine deaminase RidA (YjgF/YER057c/UK114 family)